MPSCRFVHQILQLKVQKVRKSGAFKNEGIRESGLSFQICKTTLPPTHRWMFSNQGVTKAIKIIEANSRLTNVTREIINFF